MELKTSLRFTRSTKNTHRYDEMTSGTDSVADKPVVIGQMYVQKSELPTPPPFIYVTISFEGA